MEYLLFDTLRGESRVLARPPGPLEDANPDLESTTTRVEDLRVSVSLLPHCRPIDRMVGELGRCQLAQPYPPPFAFPSGQYTSKLYWPTDQGKKKREPDNNTTHDPLFSLHFSSHRSPYPPSLTHHETWLSHRGSSILVVSSTDCTLLYPQPCRGLTRLWMVTSL